MAFDDIYSKVFVADAGGCDVTVFYAATYSSMGQISVGCSPAGPEAVAFEAITGYVYVADEVGAGDTGPGYVSVINGPTDKVVANITCSCFESPNSIAFDSFTGEMVMTDSVNSRIYIIENSTVAYFQTSASILLGISFDPNNKLFYIADSIDNAIYLFNPATNGTSMITGVSGGPVNVAYDPNDKDMYTTNVVSNTVSVISSRTNKVIATVPVGDDPQGAITYDPVNHYMYVGDLESKSASIIGNETLIATLWVGFGPEGIMYCPLDNQIFIGHWLKDSVTEFSAHKV